MAYQISDELPAMLALFLCGAVGYVSAKWMQKRTCAAAKLKLAKKLEEPVFEEEPAPTPSTPSPTASAKQAKKKVRRRAAAASSDSVSTQDTAATESPEQEEPAKPVESEQVPEVLPEVAVEAVPEDAPEAAPEAEDACEQPTQEVSARVAKLLAKKAARKARKAQEAQQALEVQEAQSPLSDSTEVPSSASDSAAEQPALEAEAASEEVEQPAVKAEQLACSEQPKEVEVKEIEEVAEIEEVEDIEEVEEIEETEEAVEEDARRQWADCTDDELPAAGSEELHTSDRFYEGDDDDSCASLELRPRPWERFVPGGSDVVQPRMKWDEEWWGPRRSKQSDPNEDNWLTPFDDLIQGSCFNMGSPMASPMAAPTSPSVCLWKGASPGGMSPDSPETLTDGQQIYRPITSSNGQALFTDGRQVFAPIQVVFMPPEQQQAPSPLDMLDDLESDFDDDDEDDEGRF